MQLSDFTFEYLSECFELDTVSGALIWKTRPDWHFAKGSTGAVGWNKLYAGKVAGCLCKDGKFTRAMVSVGDRNLRCHRIVFAIFNRIDLVEVPRIVDHANGNTLANRPGNLRGATPLQSTWNTGLRSNNKSGLKGVCWHAGEKAWRATIRDRGKCVTIGRFKDKEMAAAAYREAALRLQGEFARF